AGRTSASLRVRARAQERGIGRHAALPRPVLAGEGGDARPQRPELLRRAEQPLEACCPSFGGSAADALAQQRVARFRGAGGGVLADKRRCAARHGLLHRERKSLANARQDEQIRRLVKRAQLLGRGTVHDGCVRQSPARRIEGSPTREEPVRVGKALGQLTQHRESLLLDESAEEEEQRLVGRNAEPYAMRTPLVGGGGAEALHVDAVLHQHSGTAKPREAAEVLAYRLALEHHLVDAAEDGGTERAIGGLVQPPQ